MAKVSNAVFTAVVSRDFRSVTAPLANATFVAFRDPDGVYPDGVVWEHTESGEWTCVAWDGDSYGPSDVDDMELELMTAVADGVTNFFFGSGCSREEFFEYVFGHESESDGAYGPYDYPPHMEAPASMFAKDGWHFYDFTLDPERVEEQERELHEDLAMADEYVHEEMYGHSYRA